MQENLFKKDKCMVSIDESPSWEAYVENKRWNGWAMPAFEAKEALSVINFLSKYLVHSYNIKLKKEDKIININEVKVLTEDMDIYFYDLENNNDLEIFSSIIVNGVPCWKIMSGSFTWSIDNN